MSASDVPVREPGLRTRSGNAMARTRAAVLDAALECIARYGVRRTTMTDVVSRSRVAKGTLYNHFRTKEDLLAALVEAQVVALAEECAEVAGQASRRGDVAAGRTAALVHAATALSSSRALRRLAADEPALLVALAAPGDGRGWEAARAAVVTVLTSRPEDEEPASDAPPEAVELVLRWLAAHLAWPSPPERIAAQAALLTAGLEAAEAVDPAGSGDAGDVGRHS